MDVDFRFRLWYFVGYSGRYAGSWRGAKVQQTGGKIPPKRAFNIQDDSTDTISLLVFVTALSFF